ncbi:ANTAR domain-containing response regulator [Staphylococcus equorum]|uniref:ANTAR domain-containing response regulator n=1 Tax=Staphylococcus equorum TaxID=246432 RepID=UPI000D1CF489|nr:response regulator [Staphylococcus equorum]MCZ4236894.1 response regulator [Staphylococcus equorum]MEB7674915.1 response regulator [Staphylococcus equorum]MEB7722173.1 response regulator [Staphylococcus equorum]MEB7745766.1 response regulator [Staphylococcus equorum]MEB7776987.1 response regulator [Staphylococcus equorum]
MKSIMVVEDEAIVRMDIVEMLGEANYNVVAEVGNGEKAIEAADQFRPDLIVMDIKMPKLNGLKASKIIGKKHDIPILILTAYSHCEYVEEAKQQNIVGYIIKPISESQLLPAIEIAMSQSDSMGKLKQEVSDTRLQMEHRKRIEKAKGLLMKQLDLTEEAAYQKLRRNSMDNQIAIEKEASAIIKQLG